MRIRTATAEDIPALCALLSVLFAQEEEFTPDPRAQSRGLARIITSPELGAVLAATDGPQIVGMVVLLYTLSTALGDRVALLEDMVVSPQVRGTGIGTQLLERAVAVARARGCKRITLLTDRSNESAQRFYRKQGFELSPMVPLRLNLA
ncbi:MAG TPA: GNAT family N-acetyltransferase [Gammaproteobacteria bacterium]|nr:GNAT family N-acetyltransferase [Gammaproteobacteria bacterium]